MKKAVFLFLLFVKSNIYIFAQYQSNDNMGEYRHSIGISYLSVNQNSNYFTVRKSCAALVYNIRIDFRLGYHSSIGATIYPTVGYAPKSKIKSLQHSTIIQGGSETGAPICFEIPFMIQYNSGNHSTGVTKYKFGSFIGLGASYSYFPGTSVVIDAHKNTIISAATYLSICASGGIKFMVNNQSYGLRIHYNRPLGLPNNVAANNFSVSILYNFSKHSRFG